MKGKQRSTSGTAGLVSVVLLLTCGPAAPLAAQNLGPEWGEKYFALEAQALRVTSRFSSGVVVVTERAPDGGLESVILDHDGVSLGAMTFSPATNSIEFTTPSTAPVRMRGVPFAHVTADWANAQAASLWSDLQSLPPTEGLASNGLAWSGTLLRPRGMVERVAEPSRTHGRRVSSHIESIVSDYPTLRVVTEMDAEPSAASVSEPVGSRSTFSTRFIDPISGTRRGIMRWFAADEVLVWSIEGGSEGRILPNSVPGGWPFEPNPAWANVQALAFWQQSPPVEERGYGVGVRSISSELTRRCSTNPAAAPAGGSRDPFAGGSDPSRRVESAECTAEPDGCTGLHWLDGTVYRQCCDTHDLCYYKDRAECCTWWSWFFPWGANWSCAQCNVQVVWCFITTWTGGGGGGGSSGGGGVGCSDGCYKDDYDWCPPECQICY